MTRVKVAWVCAATWLLAASTWAAGTEHVQVELISEVTSVQPGSSFWVAVQIDHQPHWHTYWRNPGDAGFPTSIDWDLPQGLTAGEIHWPVPRLFEVEGIASLGYGDEIFLLIEMQASDSLAHGSNVELKGTVGWLECKDVCIPGEGQVNLTLPINSQPATMDHAERFATARSSLPLSGTGWAIDARVEGATLQLSVQPSADTNVKMGPIRFNPHQEGLIKYAGIQEVQVQGTSFTLAVPLMTSEVKVPDQLHGVLVADHGWDGSGGPEAVSISAPFSSTGAAEASSSDPTVSSTGLPGAMGLAFLGGLILNLMPCVFPVISLKILGFVKHAESSPAKVWHHGLVFAAGVLVCFWLLAGTLLVLKSAGEAVGWGFQLQSPAFVVSITVLFLLIALNLFGVFEIGTGLTGVGSDATTEEGYVASFSSGVLATIVATPCTAPFMAGALGVALTQPAWAAMTIFTFLGLGMAAPYLLLSRFPNWLHKVPRPGPWMESLKQGMGFMILAFAFYLVWVYTGQRGEAGLLRLLTGLLLVSIGGWVLGRWGALHRESSTRLIARVLATILVLGGAGFGMSLPTAFGWQAYSPERVEQLVTQGEPVFVDFTAQWCITCQANKKVALNRDEVQARFKELGVTIMKADWTDKNETITRALESFGRSGVPLYVLHTGREGEKPILLPELLTPSIVMNALDSL